MSQKVHLLQEERQMEMSQAIDKDEFIEIFTIANLQDGNSIKKLIKLGGDKGIANRLGTNIKVGVQSEVQVLRLRNLYGANLPVQKQMTSLWELITECFGDTMLQILIAAAVCSIVVNSIEDGIETGWMEGATILFAVILIVSITAGNNYAKQKQFRRLQAKLDESTVEVIRNGSVRHIDSKEVVVGDLLLFRIGNVFTVDGLLISGSEIKIDESSLTGETHEITKCTFDELVKKHSGGDKSENSQHPFLLSGTKVLDGTGVLLVLSVGENTIQGQMIKLMQQENPPTPLQTKLESVASDIGKLGTFVAIITFLVLAIRYLITIFLSDLDFQESFLSMETVQTMLNAFMIGVTIIVVAVPEGLPLAVTITLAYSVNKMKDEQNLVKNLASCEIMGGANNICSDKTGTLTQNLMTVVALHTESQTLLNQAIKNHERISQNTIRMLSESICYNTEANPKKSDTTRRYEQLGNKTECALIQMADDFGHIYTNYRPSENIIKTIPFNSKRKKMFTIVNQRNQIILHAKGASEMILANCNKYIVEDGKVMQLDENQKEEIKLTVINEFAKKSLRTIALAYKEIQENSIEDPRDLVNYAKNLSEEVLEQNLTLIGIVGIQDPIRPDVISSVQQCKRSGINVRMVTGDNVLTAQAIAKECGILRQEFQPGDKSYEVLEGSEFREIVGGLKSVRNKDNQETQGVKDLKRFRVIADELKVLARATPEDKYILVTGLIELGNVVAVTGDGTNDAPALRKADVGFAMGIAGSEVAREAADIILLDDNFSSIITACKWGRNIYNCIRKFIQFQLTVNVVALFMSVLGAAVISQSPLNAIQVSYGYKMLWVNLIMDTFASLALATEPPSNEVLNKPPYSRKESIVNTIMYRTIFGQSIYQIIVLCFILFLLPSYIDVSAPIGMSQTDLAKYPNHVVQMSMFFQTFVLMQVFNSITCRKLEDNSFNPFSNMFNNMIFWIIQTLTLCVQYLFLMYGGVFVGVVDLNLQQHLICLGFGAGGLIIGMFMRLVPAKWFSSFAFFKEEELDQVEMDQTITSKLRRKGSVRMKSSMASSQRLGSQVDGASIKIQGGSFKHS